MKVEKIVVGDLAENCYVVINEQKEAIIIDPGDEAQKIIDFLKPYHVIEILVTHHHFDHVGALQELTDFYHIKPNISSGKFAYQKIATPGHTMDSVSYYFPEQKCAFVGDFIFKEAIGRTDLGGNDLAMRESLQMFLKEIPLETTLYPGHGPKTTLQAEKPFLESLLK